MTTTFQLTCYDGRQYTLPAPLSWSLEYALGSPCDAFSVSIPWTPGQEEVLADATRLTARVDGELVFTGVVDECECRWQESGCTAELTGRGMQALLLDNEAETADYGVATLADILRDHVTPYGISLAAPASLPAVTGFSVSSGSSHWQVVDEFARYYAGVVPFFNRAGQLVLSGWDDSTAVCLDESVPVRSLLFREKRYGVLSQIVVRDRTKWSGSQTVVNETFQNRGGCCGRVLVLPTKSTYQTMRYNGQFQLDKSAADLRQIEVTVARPFFAWPGDLVNLQRSDWAVSNVYRVTESSVTLDEDGCLTKLVLKTKDAVL